MMRLILDLFAGRISKGVLGLRTVETSAEMETA